MEENIFEVINKSYSKRLKGETEKSVSVTLFSFIAFHLNDIRYEDILFYLIHIDLKRQKDFLMYVLDVLDQALNIAVNREDYLLCAKIHNVKLMILENGI